ncbi:Smr/MutS family protein [Phaeovulum vinaykumarii]|uniref:DNA-nicking endonuclease, Smr domain n=1 Tax=Phaeovulum vinaykumarii TaxID=407234 RepID=A0A1N7K936_9RHOB|nr:Smr/MutS family protein [Phaeovulum vinaykumarii]SIS58060.1 DNA-nicking endonuclease, Smr domain [Phaeovulum vinaykumarii]SOB93672.1 DNA-nicking Smr family endonuclease [Phaeovulum vinaykumarii]
MSGQGRKKRKLSSAERDLWARVAASATALPADARNAGDLRPSEDLPDPPLPASPPAGAARPPAARVPEKDPPRLAAFSQRIPAPEPRPEPRLRVDLAGAPAEWLAEAPVRMDRKTHQKMARGRLAPEARIDLHGMSVAQAHPALIRFVSGAHARGQRLVLVITGKGRRDGDPGPLPTRPGVLREQVPHWLHLPPLSGLVLQVSSAHARHGGSGAYYVYLRRPGTR